MTCLFIKYRRAHSLFPSMYPASKHIEKNCDAESDRAKKAFLAVKADPHSKSPLLYNLGHSISLWSA